MSQKSNNFNTMQYMHINHLTPQLRLQHEKDGVSSNMSSSNNRGFALSIVVLFIALILISISTVSIVSTLGANINVADERQAYQALLTAESGLNSFAARIDNLTAANQYRGYYNTNDASGTLSALNTWLATQGLNTLVLDANNSTQLSFTSLSGNTVTLESRSTLGNGRAQKLLYTDFDVSRSPAFNFRVPAALTSWPSVKVSGNAGVEGSNATNYDGIIDDVTTVSSNTTIPFSASSFTLPVGSTETIARDGYVSIDGMIYRVSDKTSSSLTLDIISGTPPASISSGTDVDLIASAASQAVNSASSGSTTFTVSDNTGFLVSDEVNVGSFNGTVTAIDADNGTITVQWSGTSPSTLNPIAEGTPIVRNIFDVAANGSISVRGGGDACQSGTSGAGADCQQNDPIVANPFSGDPDLFEQTVGLSYTDFSSIYPSSSFSSGALPFSGVTHLSGNIHLTGGSSLCGSGILIVDGNLTINGTCANGFKGVIYVRGDFRMQGNATITGAVVAEGATEFFNPSNETTVSGTGRGNSKLEYDDLSVLSAGTLLSAQNFSSIPGSWRQR